MSNLVTSSNQHIDAHVLRIVRRKLAEELGVDPTTIVKAHTRRLAEMVKERVYCAGETNVAVLRNFAQGQYRPLSEAPKRPAAPVLRVAGHRDMTIKAGRIFSMASMVRHNLERINEAQPPMASIGMAAPIHVLWREA